MGRGRARFGKKNYFSKDPDQLSMAVVRPEGITSRAPPKVLPRARRRVWSRLRWVASWAGSSTLLLVVFFAEGTRDAVLHWVIEYTLGRPIGSEHPVAKATRPDDERPAIAQLPPGWMAAPNIETGSLGNAPDPAMRPNRKRASRQDTNPVMRFGWRMGEAIDELFGVARRDR